MAGPSFPSRYPLASLARPGQSPVTGTLDRQRYPLRDERGLSRKPPFAQGDPSALELRGSGVSPEDPERLREVRRNAPTSPQAARHIATWPRSAPVTRKRCGCEEGRAPGHGRCLLLSARRSRHGPARGDAQLSIDLAFPFSSSSSSRRRSDAAWAGPGPVALREPLAAWRGPVAGGAGPGPRVVLGEGPCLARLHVPGVGGGCA